MSWFTVAVRKKTLTNGYLLWLKHHGIFECDESSNEIKDEDPWQCMTVYAGERITIEKKLLVEETWGYSEGSFSLNETTAASTYTNMKISCKLIIYNLSVLKCIKAKCQNQDITGTFNYQITYIRLREKIGSWDFKFVLWI